MWTTVNCKEASVAGVERGKQNVVCAKIRKVTVDEIFTVFWPLKDFYSEFHDFNQGMAGSNILKALLWLFCWEQSIGGQG